MILYMTVLYIIFIYYIYISSYKGVRGLGAFVANTNPPWVPHGLKGSKTESAKVLPKVVPRHPKGSPKRSQNNASRRRCDIPIHGLILEPLPVSE